MKQYISISLFALLLCETVGTCGHVIGWGENGTGTITGIPRHGITNGIVSMSGVALSSAVAIAAGAAHGLALKSDGTVCAWGANHYHQCSVPESATNVVAISAKANLSLALRNDHSVIAWGQNTSGQTNVPADLTNVIAFAAGDAHALALRSDGTVARWGGLPIPLPHAVGISNIVAVAACADFEDVALTKNGLVYHWASFLSTTRHPAKIYPGLSNVISITCGGQHCLALKSDGTVFGWGANQFGQATGIASTNISEVMTSGVVTVKGQIISNIVAIAAGSSSSMALKRDGTVIAWGYGSYRDAPPPGLSNVVAIAEGASFSLVIKRKDNE